MTTQELTTPVSADIRFDITGINTRRNVVSSGGDLDVLRELTSGVESDFEYLLHLYAKAYQDAGFIEHSFIEHGILPELNHILTVNDRIHLAWQMALDAVHRRFITQYQNRFVAGPVPTQLTDSLLMATKLPQLIPETADTPWVDIGSGTGMAAIPMAIAGRTIVGIERVAHHYERAIQNQQDLENLLGRKTGASFIQGSLPEHDTDLMDSTMANVLRRASVWYCYPWTHEIDNKIQLSRVELFRQYANDGAYLILYTAEDPVTFTVDEIKEQGLNPLGLSNGEYMETLGYPHGALWSVWTK